MKSTVLWKWFIRFSVVVCQFRYFYPRARNFFVKTSFSMLLLVAVSQCVKITEFYCHLFSQKFRESNLLLKIFTLNWFDEKNSAWLLMSRFCTAVIFSVNLHAFTIDSSHIRKVCKINYFFDSFHGILFQKEFPQFHAMTCF